MRSVHFFALSSMLLAIGHPGFAGYGLAEVTEQGVECEISVTRSARSVELAGTVVSGISATGTFEFDVEKAGGGGTATSSQSGTFSVEAGGTAVLGEVTLGMHGTDAAYEARLTVEWQGGKTSCHSASDDD